MMSTSIAAQAMAAPAEPVNARLGEVGAMTLQDLIADAIDEGLECAAGIHLDREAVISTDDQQSAAWIAFLTRAGFAFSNPISCYAIPGGTACEATDASGRRVVLRMLREDV